MARNSEFRHKAEVLSVDVERGVVVVTMRSSTACEGCHAKGYCTSGGGLSGEEGQMRSISVERRDAAMFSVGEVVELSITHRIGLYAVLVAYVLPLILFVISIAVLIAMGVEEGVAAIAGSLFGAIYYGMIYLLRDRFENIVYFGLRQLK